VAEWSIALVLKTRVSQGTVGSNPTPSADMKLLIQNIKPYKKILFWALVLATINQGFSLLDPLVFRIIIDNYASKAASLSRHEFITGVLWLSLATVGIAFVSRVAKNFQDYYLNVVTQKVGTGLYAQSIGHAFSLPFSAFEDQRSGELLSKLQKARSDSQTLIMSFVGIVFLSLVSITFVMIYAFTVYWLIGAMFLLLIPTLSSITYYLGRKIKSAQRSIVKETAALAGSTTETLRNVELVKSLGLEEQEINHLNSVNNNVLGLELKKIKMIRVLSFIQGTLVNALRTGLSFLMLYLIFQGTITLGEFFSLLFYSFFIFEPLGQLGTVSAQYQEARASLEQLEEILSTEPEERPLSAQDPQELSEIKFENVSFSYANAEHLALENISLNISRGETVAFVGPSGSGKSTLVKLLVGLYRPTEGEIMWNNIPHKDVDFDKIRMRIGLVLQETQLFAGTVRENLLFVRPKATDEECWEVLRLASINEVFEKSQGLDTRIGEGGMKLSGGERQRLAIARSLLRQPDILIFDEATSSLDSVTEHSVTTTIREIDRSKSNFMSVLVAHRLSTISHADRIYVLEKGKIAEVGTHDELLEKKGLYAALWRQQIGERTI
jgi:ATP-binding cassette, subfamily B, bacterial